MLLISDAGGFWGTEWDDQPIRPENFREWKKEETESHKEKKTEKGTEKNGEKNAEAEERVKKLVFLQKCRKNRMQQTRS